MSIKAIQIFKPGRHTAVSGATLDFTEADLRASAAAYDPTLHEAPLVIGHPDTNAPAYGWVKALSYADGLEAEPAQVDPAFAELVNAGRYKHISASFYAPDSPTNPKAGVYYLRHVGFLGAQPPAVKGLKAVQFADHEQGIVEIEFSEPGEDSLLLQLARALKRLIVSDTNFAEPEYAGPHQSFPITNADDVRKAWNLAGHAADPDAVRAKIMGIAIKHGWTAALPDTARAWAKQHDVKFSEEDVTVNETELQKQREELAAAKASQEAAFAEREKKLASAEANAAIAANLEFVESLVKDGKVLPRDKESLVLFMASLKSADIMEFTEASGKVTKSVTQWLKDFLEALPERVNFSEMSRRQDPATAAPAFRVPPGYAVDANKIELHQMALAYAESHKVDYVTAVQALSRSN